MKISTHAYMQFGHAKQLDPSYLLVLIFCYARASEQMSTVSVDSRRRSSETERTHSGVCTVLKWWKDRARKGNCGELCVTAQCLP